LGRNVGVIVGVSHEIFEPRARSAFRCMQLAGQRWYQSHVNAVIVGVFSGLRHRRSIAHRLTIGHAVRESDFPLSDPDAP
jgi:hypothetical protein